MRRPVSRHAECFLQQLYPSKYFKSQFQFRLGVAAFNFKIFNKTFFLSARWQLATFSLEEGMVTAALFAARPLRIRGQHIRDGSCVCHLSYPVIQLVTITS